MRNSNYRELFALAIIQFFLGVYFCAISPSAIDNSFAVASYLLFGSATVALLILPSHHD